MSEVRVGIVGGGASGGTAALYCARAGLSVTVFDQGRTTLKRALLNNFPGAPSVEGVDWMSTVHDQLAAYDNVTIIDGKVDDCVLQDDGSFVLESGEGNVSAKYVIFASGQGTAKFAENLGVNVIDPIQPYVKVNFEVDRWGETAVSNLFAAGLVAGMPSQAIICAGSGANSAMRIASLEKGEFWVDHDDTLLGTES